MVAWGLLEGSEVIPQDWAVLLGLLAIIAGILISAHRERRKQRKARILQRIMGS